MNRTLNDWAGNIVALIIVIVVNSLANILQFGGQTTGAVSDKYYSLFTPAGFTFAVWSIIYLGLAVFVVYQSMPAQRQNESLAKLSPWFKVGCVANVLWIFVWHMEWIMVALLLIVALLVSLARVYRFSSDEAWQVRWPFSLYLGWISVATIANISAMQSALGWNDLGIDAVAWTLVKLAIAGAITVVVVLRRHDLVYGLVVAWAAFGISAGQVATPAVAGAATTLYFLLLLLLIHDGVRQLRSR
jgi:hypothetical protein